MDVSSSLSKGPPKIGNLFTLDPYLKDFKKDIVDRWENKLIDNGLKKIDIIYTTVAIETFCNLTQ